VRKVWVSRHPTAIFYLLPPTTLAAWLATDQVMRHGVRHSIANSFRGVFDQLTAWSKNQLGELARSPFVWKRRRPPV
jgi:hypothetical protein